MNSVGGATRLMELLPASCVLLPTHFATRQQNSPHCQLIANKLPYFTYIGTRDGLVGKENVNCFSLG